MEKVRQISLARKELYYTWKDDFEDMPFSLNVNEQHVLSAIEHIHSLGGMDDDIIRDIWQWMRFNKSANEYETELYQTWVRSIYSKIDHLCDEADFCSMKV